MGGFSTTQQVDNPISQCQRGNIFLNRLPLEAPPIQFSVNGQSTGALPTDLIYKLDNSLEGTTSRLTMTPDGGEEITIIEDLDQFSRSRPEDVGVILTQANLSQSPAPYIPRGRLMEYAIQTTSQSSSEDVLVLEITPGSVPEGEHDVDTISGDLAFRISSALLNGLELADRLSSADDMLQWSRDNLRIGDVPILVDFTVTGTDGPPMVAEIIATIAYNRHFLIDTVHQQSRIVKVWTSGAGELLMSFRYAQPVRGFIQGLVMSMSAKHVARISAGATQSLRPLSKDVARKLPLIGVSIVVSVEVLEYFATEPSKRELSALLAALFVEVGSVIIGGIVGGFLAALILYLISSTLILVTIGVGIAAGIFVGIGLTSLTSHLELEKRVKDGLDYLAGGLEGMAQRLEHLVEDVDAAIYDPIEWGTDVYRGLNEYINDRANQYINHQLDIRQ